MDHVFGMLLVRADSTVLDNTERRWWFELTDACRPIFTQEVTENESGRLFSKKHEASIPQEVVERLRDEGFTQPLWANGNKVQPSRGGGSA
jgi:hypothetical protein